MRLSRVDGLADGVEPAPARLRIGGWAVAGPTRATLEPAAAAVCGSRLSSRLVALSGPAARPGFAEYDDASPLGPGVRVPWLEYPVEVGRWVCVLVELHGTARTPERPATVAVEAEGGDRWNVRVLWPDGCNTSTHISDSEAATAATP